MNSDLKPFRSAKNQTVNSDLKPFQLKAARAEVCVVDAELMLKSVGWAQKGTNTNILHYFAFVNLTSFLI